MSIAAFVLSEAPLGQASMRNEPSQVPPKRTLVPIGDPLVIPEAR